MKIRPVTVGIVAAVLMSGAAFALAEARIPRKPLRAMTCHDFLLVEDAAKPEIVYWAATYRKDGKPDRTVIDVDDTDRIVPVVVEVCRQVPHELLWQTVRAETKKLEDMETRRKG